MLLDKVTTRREPRPRRVLLYGTAGIGKSTWASMAPKPVFVQTEDSLTDIDCAHFPIATSYADVCQAVHELATEDHHFETVVVDSVDWLEKLIAQQVCEEGGKESLADFGFGKGYETAVSKWLTVFGLLDAVHQRGLHVVLVGHSQISRFEDPVHGSYDRFEPRVHKKSLPLVVEWCTEVLFASYRAFVKSEDQGFGKSRKVAVGDGERIVKTQERPTHIAKNRLGLPYELPLDWDAFASHLGGRTELEKVADEVF